MSLRIKAHPAGGVSISEASAPGTRHHFTPRLVERAMAQGWLTLHANQLVLQGDKGALVYRVDRPPGIYCCHCQAPMADGPEALAHVGRAHPGQPSPDASNPAGYRHDHFYAATRVE